MDTGRFENMLARRAWLRHLPWVMLALMLAGTWLIWQNAERHAMQARQVEFDLRVQAAAERIKQRMLDYEQMLHGVRGFLTNQHGVEHREFSGYIDALQLAQQFPGIRGVSYAPLVPAQRKQAHVAAMRRDGLDGYVIRPEGARGLFAPVAYIAPHSARNQGVLGFDNFSSPQRRATLEQARDLDRAIVTEKLTLVQDEGAAAQAGGLMFLPVYRAGPAHETLEARRATIAGWLAVSFRMADMFAGAIAGDADVLDMKIYDGEASPQSLLFDSGHGGLAAHVTPPRYRTDLQVEIAGRAWRIAAHSTPAFEAGVDNSKAQLTALSALLFSIVVTWSIALLVRDRGHAMKLAEGAGSELRRNKAFQDALLESEQRWKLALEAAGHGVWDWDLRTDEVVCTELSKQMRGYTADDYPYRFFKEWGAGVHPEDLPKIPVAIQEHFEGKTLYFSLEYRALCKNGAWKWIVTRGMVVERDEAGKPMRMLGTHTDVSERKAAETALQLSEAKFQAIIDHAPVGIWLVGVDGRYHFLNKTFCDSVGVPERKFLEAKHLGDVLGEEAAAACIRSDREALALDAPHISHETLNFVDGKEHQLEIRKVRLQDHLGETIGVLGISVDVTEQHEREEELRESEERYRGIFNNSSYFIYTHDTAGRITFVPPVIEKLTGYAADELLGEHISRVLTPDSLMKALEMTAAKLEGKAVVTQYELKILRKDGSITPIEVNTSLMYRQGKVVGVQGVGRDITERHQYAQSLRENEEKYRGLFESAGDYAYSTDLAGNFVAISETLLVATGYRRGELTSITQILSPQQLDLARKMTAAKVSGEKPSTRYELELTGKNGQTIPVEIVSTLVYRENKPVGVQGIGREIAERKRAEEMLRRSERKYRELMEQAAEAIFVTDREWQRCEDVNQAACDLLGYTREEMLQLDVGKIFRPDQMAGGSGKPGAEQVGRVSYARRRLRRKDGTHIPVELSSRMLPDGRLQAFARDISQWIERESALKEANIKAESASRAKSEFLANMSHEIRTPMNSVIGMARLALSRETDVRQIGYMEKILMSGEHLLGIIDDILDFSKIEAGKMRIESTDLDLRGVMDNLASLMVDKAAAKGLEFVKEIDPALPAKMQGDPLRLRQVLLNFTENAIKFTTRGWVKVSVRKVDDEVGACSVLFEVSDSGIGMSPAEMAMLFRPFQQTDGSVTRKYGGTGLGLSISKRLVELMGGETGVESELGHGSKFWFKVRLDEGRQDEGSQAEQVVDRRDAQAAIRNARVLLAENNVFNQQVAREFLEEAGCVVQVANDGVEALEWLRKEHFDCVLMDVQMPLMDGLEATRQIRASQAFAAMPVIAVTANALEEERQRCMDAGMNDFVTKPLRPETLYVVMAKWLSRQVPPLSVPERRKPSEGAASASVVIDLSALAELVGGSREKMRQMAYKFIDCTRQDMDKVSAALERSELPRLKEMAHHIKAPAAMVGAAGLADLCRELEANHDDLERAREVVARMHALFAEIEVQIEAQLP